MSQRTWVMVDVEANGPHPYPYSMTEIGAVVVEPGLNRTFYGRSRPISQYFDPNAQSVSGYSLKEQQEWEMPAITMRAFEAWLETIEGPMFVSDNNGFDWQFVNWYLWTYTGSNPFGHSSTNLGSLYKGMVGDIRKNFKHLRKTKHDHNPLNDAIGNAEAMLTILDRMARQKTFDQAPFSKGENGA